MLEVDGGNWPIFRIKFKVHVNSVGLGEHFLKDNYPADSYEDVEAKPTREPNESDGDHKKRVDVWNDGEAKWKERIRVWRKEDAKARAALGGVVPDSIYMEISEFKKFHEMWEAVEVHIERITPRLKSNLKRRLSQMHCNEKDNVIAHLQEMEWIYQQLASLNAKISDEDYVDAIIRSLPRSYSNLVTTLLTLCDQMKVSITPADVQGAVRRECGMREVAAISWNRRPNEAVPHIDTKGRGRWHGRGRRGATGRGGSQRGG